MTEPSDTNDDNIEQDVSAGRLALSLVVGIIMCALLIGAALKVFG